MKSSVLYGGDLHSALDWLCLNLKDGNGAPTFIRVLLILSLTLWISHLFCQMSCQTVSASSCRRRARRVGLNSSLHRSRNLLKGTPKHPTTATETPTGSVCWKIFVCLLDECFLAQHVSLVALFARSQRRTKLQAWRTGFWGTQNKAVTTKRRRKKEIRGHAILNWMKNLTL